MLRCSIVALAGMAIANAAPSFTRDVAPILYKHCASCHHPGEVAPFPLLSYEDAARRARLLAKVVESRYMPPWKPAAGYGHFAGERRLTNEEIRTIAQWAAAGAPEGDRKRLPAPPQFNDDWRLGKPDLVARMPYPAEVPAAGADQYMCYVIPLALDRDRYVRAVEFRPSNRRIVHHALLFTDAGHAARDLDRESGGRGYSCFGTPGFLFTAALGGWSPGSGPVEQYPDTAIRLQRGSVLVIQEHFHPSGKPETEQSSVALYFTDQAPSKHIVDIALISRTIDIPPGDALYKVRDHFTLPVDVHAVGIIPHAHYICKDVKGWAILPNGRKVWLIWIQDWNFDWQEQYRYAEPVALPEGTRVEMEFTYDNSESNPRNPNSPPKRVQWGPGSADEMAGLHIQVIPDRMEDLPELGQALWGKIMRMVGGSFYRLPQPEKK